LQFTNNYELLNNKADTNSLNYIEMSNSKQKFKILIIEDSELIRKSIVKVFNGIENFKDNFELIEGCDGIDTLKIIMDDQRQGNKILGIISDENMEYLHGSKAFYILKEFESHKKIKFIKKFSLTAFSDEQTIKDMKNNGSDEIFIKPLSSCNAKKILSLISDD